MTLQELECAAGDDSSALASVLFELGMIYSAGASVPVDYIAAHKWFNLAAMRGNKDAVDLRREIAAQMSDADVGVALRAARAWLKARPQEPRAQTTSLPAPIALAA